MREAKIWREIRDKLSTDRLRLWRNEVGNGVAIRHRNSHQRQAIINACIATAEKMGGSGARISFGLAVGSGDLIGEESVTITPEMVGTVIARFTSVETKTATGAVRAQQQLWMDFVNRVGGKAIIARSVDDARKALDTPVSGMPQSPHTTGSAK